MTETLSARTRELLDSVMAGETIFSGSSSFACATARKAQPHPDSARRLVMAAKADDDSERLLTPRLMSLLEPAAPQAAEVGAVHASLESLQSTLGAAYMLLAAECKAETLEAQVSLARARLADHVTVGLGMYTGIIHGRHLSLFSLGWRAGRSGGSRLAVAITISHSKPKEATCGTVPLN